MTDLGEAFKDLLEDHAQKTAEVVLQSLQAGDIYNKDAAGAKAIRPDGFYSAKELAFRWGFVVEEGKHEGKARTSTVYEISEEELPRHRVGPSRGRTLFYGLDVMRYEGTISQEAYDALQERKQQVFQNTPQEPARIRRLRNA